MGQPQPAYLSYVLRLWRTDGHWRASLIDPLTGERVGFASLDLVIAFLKRQMDRTRDVHLEEKEENNE